MVPVEYDCYAKAVLLRRSRRNVFRNSLRMFASYIVIKICYQERRFPMSARDEVDMERLAAALLSVVEETMQPESISLVITTRDAE